jgi:hypothetical protein
MIVIALNNPFFNVANCLTPYGTDTPPWNTNAAFFVPLFSPCLLSPTLAKA